MRDIQIIFLQLHGILDIFCTSNAQRQDSVLLAQTYFFSCFLFFFQLFLPIVFQWCVSVLCGDDFYTGVCVGNQTKANSIIGIITSIVCVVWLTITRNFSLMLLLGFSTLIQCSVYFTQYLTSIIRKSPNEVCKPFYSIFLKQPF